MVLDARMTATPPVSWNQRPSLAFRSSTRVVLTQSLRSFGAGSLFRANLVRPGGFGRQARRMAHGNLQPGQRTFRPAVQDRNPTPLGCPADGLLSRSLDCPETKVWYDSAQVAAELLSGAATAGDGDGVNRTRLARIRAVSRFRVASAASWPAQHPIGGRGDVPGLGGSARLGLIPPVIAQRDGLASAKSVRRASGSSASERARS
jgi:hypothetical protein